MFIIYPFLDIQMNSSPHLLPPPDHVSAVHSQLSFGGAHAQHSATGFRSCFFKWRWGLGVAAVIGLFTAASVSVHAQSVRVSGENRWLEVEQLRGSVMFFDGRQRRRAQVGDRLQRPNHGVNTASQSTTTLALDTDIGVIRVAEQTNLFVRAMRVLADGGRVTLLTVDQGQARIQARRFTHPSSRLELETPSGVAAVRGTDFGVNVEPSGKTAIATLSGTVEASAQGVSVLVNAGFGTTIVPGEPPTPPRPLDRIMPLESIRVQRTSSSIRISGNIDPLNTLLIDGTPINTADDGAFRTTLSGSPFDYATTRSLTLTVRNPVGEERDHVVRVRDFESR